MRHKWYDVIVAWAEGKEIQYRFFDGDWFTSNSEYGIYPPNFNMDGVEWRIKPDIKTLKYRIALVHRFDDKDPVLELYTPEDDPIEIDTARIRWVTDWIEVEI